MADTHRAIFIGEIHRRNWRFIDNNRSNDRGVSYYSKPLIRKESYKIDNKKIFECILEKPPLTIKEKIYINELDITVEVKDKVRSTNGETIYYTNYIVEIIEDEKSQLSLQKEQKLLDEEMVFYNDYLNRKEVMKLREKLKEEKKSKRKWYQFFS